MELLACWLSPVHRWASGSGSIGSFFNDISSCEGVTMEVTINWVPGLDVIVDPIAAGSRDMLIRPCADCGVYTGSFCDNCNAEDRFPNEEWADGQGTPLCTRCDRTHDECHFCRGVKWCVPPPRR